MGMTIQNGVIRTNVTFTDSPKGAEEILYNEKRRNKDTGEIMYFHKGYLVAVV